MVTGKMVNGTMDEEKKQEGQELHQVFSQLDVILAGIALTVLVGVTFVGVFMRYFFGHPFALEEEVQLACFVWITFLGVGAAFRSGSHVAIELLVDRFPLRVVRMIEIGGYVISMLVLLYFAWYSIVLLGKMDMMGRDTNILHIPYVAIYSVVPVGCLLMMWNYTQSIRKRLRAYKEGGLD